jgi:hypothetical protein
MSALEVVSILQEQNKEVKGDAKKSHIERDVEKEDGGNTEGWEQNPQLKRCEEHVSKDAAFSQGTRPCSALHVKDTLWRATKDQ